MKLIGENECYSKMENAEYGNDAYKNKVMPPEGYEIVSKGEKLKKGDRPFDVYSGWLSDGYLNLKYNIQAVSSGRWTAWARKK